MPKISGIIFDLDGTLLDTLVDIADAFNSVLRKRSLPVHPPARYRKFVGEGPRVLAERALPEAHRLPETIEECLKSYLEVYRGNPNPSARPYSGIPALLDALSERRVPMAVVSNKEQAAADIAVRDVLGAWRFSPVFGFRDGVPKKPAPDMALAAAATLDLAPEQIAFVGDTAVDMKTAAAAQMMPVGVLWGFRGEEELRAHGAKILLEHPQALLSHLQGTPWIH